MQRITEEIRRYDRKRLYELSLKSLGEIPHLEDPDYYQKCWVIRRVKGTWKRWYAE